MESKVNTRFMRVVENGWFHNPLQSINRVYEIAHKMILNRENRSEVICIFHATAVQGYFKSTTDGIINITIIDQKVCSGVVVELDIDFESMGTEYFKLLASLKNNPIKNV